ncbi:MAG: hypothetical protein KDJ19_12110 [Hyphomicrobiaceae bacterium]|nr:hypothetical protein [Hyphomicrobiaceae bacterium]MCC0022923.1 hypothetical protein [Hyphomicrobiaceae bacterium]
MLRRFGLTGRLFMIGLVGFLSLLTLFGILLYQLRSQEGALRAAFPIITQIAAMVSSIDAVPIDRRDDLVFALNSPTVDIAIASDLPSEGERTQRVGLVENRLSEFPELAGREVRVISEIGPPLQAGPIAWSSGIPIMVAVELSDGKFVVIRTRATLLPRYFGVPNGFWLAALSLLIAGITLVALVRETRPLRELTAAVKHFSQNATPTPVKPSGAEDVRGLIESINGMQERIGAMVKGRTILAGAISHDLKTYLTRLQLRVEDIPDDKERAAAEGDIASMLAIVENAMSFAKSATGTRDREDVDLVKLTEAEAARFRNADCRIAVEATDDLHVQGDPVALGRVLANLLENAQRYAGEVRVQVARDGDMARVIVDDDGPGIPAGERETVFEPYYRLDPARNTQTGGSGLGLALCRQIVETHGGEIVISESPAGGARLIMTLPVSPAG